MLCKCSGKYIDIYFILKEQMACQVRRILKQLNSHAAPSATELLKVSCLISIIVIIIIKNSTLFHLYR